MVRLLTAILLAIVVAYVIGGPAAAIVAPFVVIGLAIIVSCRFSPPSFL